jgi:hypothetical protein
MRYYFNLQNDPPVHDRVGMEYATPEEAKAHGTIVAGEIGRNNAGHYRGYSWSSLTQKGRNFSTCRFRLKAI